MHLKLCRAASPVALRNFDQQQVVPELSHTLHDIGQTKRARIRLCSNRQHLIPDIHAASGDRFARACQMRLVSKWHSARAARCRYADSPGAIELEGGPLDGNEAQDVSVEVDAGLYIAADPRDVIQAADGKDRGLLGAELPLHARTGRKTGV